MSDSASTLVVSLRNLRFAWPQGPTLNVGSLTVKRGEHVFVQGPSGSGKSTLLGLIGGVLQPSAGEIEVLGQRLNELNGWRRDAFRAAHVGFVFQMFNLLPYLSVVNNVLLPARFSPERRGRALARGAGLREEALRLLTALGLSDSELLSRRVTDLSVGQQQRVAVARALFGSPELIVADEPTSSLDADLKDAFLTLLFKECADAGATVLFVSHDSSLARHFDRTLHMRDINRA
jgi:putative ABC transport system ATP-binding protein